jgi:hypothetical protein
VTEVVVRRPACHQQRIVLEHAVAEDHAPRLDVDVDYLAEQHRGVALLVQDVAQRRGDLARRQGTGRHLVEERLKEVKVAPVDQRDLHRRTPQRLCRIKSAETAPDDDHPGCRGRHARYSTSS